MIQMHERYQSLVFFGLFASSPSLFLSLYTEESNTSRSFSSNGDLGCAFSSYSSTVLFSVFRWLSFFTSQSISLFPSNTSKILLFINNGCFFLSMLGQVYLRKRILQLLFSVYPLIRKLLFWYIWYYLIMYVRTQTNHPPKLYTYFSTTNTYI